MLQKNKLTNCRAVIPDLLRFGYIPADQVRLNSSEDQKGKKRASSPTYALPSASILDDEDHVLVFEFIESTKKYKSAELIEACPGDGADGPVELVKQAARDHIPVKAKGDVQQSLVMKNAERPPMTEIIEELRREDWYRDQIVEHRSLPRKDPLIGELAVPLPENVVEGLHKSRGISKLYKHQADAINAVKDGKHVIVCTATASGKSVIYQVPALLFLEEDKDSTAIYIYPTKALAQDQRLALDQLVHACPGLEDIKVSTYDGDTPKEKRPQIRESASVIFTNFDMLHASILPQEDKWRRFLKNLKIVAVDELHYYSGPLGSHVAQIMRRLRRVCAAVGNRHVRYVSCSATIAQPRKHMSSIFGIEDIEVITEDGSPAGPKEFLVWNPPLVDQQLPKSGRTSPFTQTTALMRFLMKRGVRTIVFCKIRKTCEIVMKILRTELTAEGRADILQRVMAYRGGYSQDDRRKIEAEAFSGNLLGIVATNALELGVDIGNLDAVIIHGFPVNIASLRQQAGRAGRRARDSLAVLVVDTYGIDQHYAKHPEELFDKAPEKLHVDLGNRVILEGHLQCAADEMPINVVEDQEYFGPQLDEICNTRLKRDSDGWYHTHPQYLPYPSTHVSIRGSKEETYSIIDITRLSKGGEARVLEEIEASRVLFEAYEGAVFIHQGLTFLVEEISHDTRTAKVIRTDVNWTTKPRDFTNYDAVRTYRIREMQGTPHRAFYGKIDVKTVIFGYFKMRQGKILDAVDLESPPFERDTTGFWFDVPKENLKLMKQKGMNPAEAIHAACHAILNRFDLGHHLRTECKIPQREYQSKPSQRKRPARLVFFDPPGTGASLSAKAFDYVSGLVHEAFETVESCECKSGCTYCIQSTTCKESNIVSSKLGARVVLRGLLNLPLEESAIPLDETGITNTIVDAEPVRIVPGVEVEPCDA
ncbi:hypothetical protein FRB91_010520 [Serendipita sp. 411]|nr:hypothetical protein FRB91_010520 [Serendipita sp. 411]